MAPEAYALRILTSREVANGEVAGTAVLVVYGADNTASVVYTGDSGPSAGGDGS